MVIDIPRANEGNVSYQAIEDLKNGALFSTKYESGMCVFNSPHVVVFANMAPDLNKLSADRWNIIHLHDTVIPIGIDSECEDLVCYEVLD